MLLIAPVVLPVTAGWWPRLAWTAIVGTATAAAWYGAESVRQSSSEQWPAVRHARPVNRMAVVMQRGELELDAAAPEDRLEAIDALWLGSPVEAWLTVVATAMVALQHAAPMQPRLIELPRHWSLVAWQRHIVAGRLMAVRGETRLLIACRPGRPSCVVSIAPATTVPRRVTLDELRESVTH